MDLSTYPQESLQHDLDLLTDAEPAFAGAPVAEPPDPADQDAEEPEAAAPDAPSATSSADDHESLINLIQGGDPEGEAVALSGLAVAIITETARDLMGPEPPHPDTFEEPLPIWRRRDLLSARKTRREALAWVRESEYIDDAWDDRSDAYILSLARCVQLMNAQLIARHGENSRMHSLERLRRDLLERPEQVVNAMGVRATRADETEPSTGGGSMFDRRMTPTHGLDAQVAMGMLAG